jgi:hypothetical protein
MTAQISDVVIYKEEHFALIGIGGGRLLSPERFGMCSEMLHTGCYRGFCAVYELTETELLLRELVLREKYGNYLPIGGVFPEKYEHHAHYRNLSAHVPFTGKMRLAKDFIEDFYIHMGYQKPTAFKTVYDITLQDGRIIDLKDRSKEMDVKRGAFKKRYELTHPVHAIAEAFSLDLDLE